MKTYILGAFNAAVLAAAMLCAVASAQNSSESSDFSEALEKEWGAEAKKGDVKAQCRLGVIYAEAERYPEAVRWLRKAAGQRPASAAAQWFLGDLHLNGFGVAEDKQEALRWFRKAAENGHAEAHRNLSLMYAQGDVVAKDDREALRLFVKAAELGHVESQFALGASYSTGDKYVAKDEREALRWFRMAAEQGHLKAQSLLGIIYAEIVRFRDLREAVRWTRKAAEQNSAASQKMLGRAYWHGHGVITDKREAYIWYSLAKANGDVDGDDSAAEYLRTNNWREYLSKSEIHSAEKEAAKRMEEFDTNRKAYEISQALTPLLSCK
ncbi:MAG: sel1 repeat family protein [Alphaproteobacteria bacterium]|nr:sel1 repeat family protein [Alphaproteobacteria bacterium]